MTRIPRGRSLLLVLVALAIVAAVADFLSPDSTIRGTWRRLSGSETPLERAVDDFQRTRVIPRPRSN